MTYDNVLQWLIDNVPVNSASSYNEWLALCKSEVNTPSLWESSNFNSRHEDAYENISKRSIDREQESLSELGEGELPDKMEVTRRPDIGTGSVETRITYREPLTYNEITGQRIPDKQVIDVRENVDSPVIEDRTENQAERIVRPVARPTRLNRVRAFVNRLFRRKDYGVDL